MERLSSRHGLCLEALGIVSFDSSKRSSDSSQRVLQLSEGAGDIPELTFQTCAVVVKPASSYGLGPRKLREHIPQS